MKHRFTNTELRIIGCLIEKEKTTPDNYPLSLNALTIACNQKTNRDPIMDLSEILVRQTADNLVGRSILSNKSKGSSRVIKYSHRLRRSDKLFDEFAFDDDEIAVLAVLFLRGPQTLAEIKTRTSRLYPFESLEAIADCIAKLEAHAEGPFATLQPRQTGQKEDRYHHLLGRETTGNVATPAVNERPPGAGESTAVGARATGPDGSGSAAERMEALERRVAALEATVSDLAQKISD